MREVVRRARAIYDSIFPPSNPAGEQRDNVSLAHAVRSANGRRSEEDALP
jgi:hypothetical protein